MSAIGGVFGMWEQVVGESMAAHVQPIKLNGSALVVEVDDPAWATQLKFLEQSLRQDSASEELPSDFWLLWDLPESFQELSHWFFLKFFQLLLTTNS